MTVMDTLRHGVMVITRGPVVPKLRGLQKLFPGDPPFPSPREP